MSKFLECKSLKDITVALRHCRHTLLLQWLFFSLISSNLRYSPEQLSLFSGNTLNVKEHEMHYISATSLFYKNKNFSYQKKNLWRYCEVFSLLHPGDTLKKILKLLSSSHQYLSPSVHFLFLI